MNARTNPLITLVLLKCVYDLMRKGFATLSFNAHGITTSLFHTCDAIGIVGILLRCPSVAAPAQGIDLERQPSKFRKLGNTPAYLPSRFPLTQPASMIAFAILLHYEYSPFGETVVATGPNASEFLHRFSTKPAEDNTGLVLYEYRPYSPSLGRWLSRDPIGERGGRNLYGFVQNRVVYSFDYLGLKCIVTSGPSVLEGAEWTLSKVDLACIGTSPKHCESVETEWTKAGEVSCCCRRFWFWKRTTNKSVNMTINKSENISFPITAYKPGDMPLTVPGFSTIAEGLGEVLGELGGLILGEIVSWRVDANDAKEITAAAQRTKPESTEEGTWPEDPCE